jgi:hypothetical protein
MPSGHGADEQLGDVCQVVAPLDVRPLVDDDAIELVRVKTCDERWCDRDDRSAAAEHGRRAHAIGKNQARGPACLTRAPPVCKCGFNRW